MPEIRIDAESTRLAVGIRLTCQVRVPYDLVLECQRKRLGVLRNRPIGSLPELWPWQALRVSLLGQAKTFLEQMRLQGYEPLEGETTLRVWGPYMQKVDWAKAKAEFLPEAGNPVIPSPYKKKAVPVWGYRGDEFRIDKGLVFLIVGKFMATHGHQDEQKGMLIV